MNIRSLLTVCATIASLAVPSLASAQVRFHAGVTVGGPRHYPPPVVAQPAPVVVAQPAPPVYVAPPVYAQPAAPVVVARPAPMFHRRHRTVIVTPGGVVIDRHHRHGWRR